MTSPQPRPPLRWQGSAAPGGALPSLASLRFAGALAVFHAHGALEGLFRNQLFAGLYGFTALPAAYLAVSFFFILSGFVLTWSRREGEPARSFWRRRFFRIMPSHVVAVALAFVLMMSVERTTGVLPAVAQLSLVHAWIPSPDYYNNLNGVTWSLSVEAFCYVLFPLVLIPFVGRIKLSRLWFWLIGAVLVVAMVPLVARALLPDDPAHPLSQLSLLTFVKAIMNPDQPFETLGHLGTYEFWFIYHLPLVRALEFFIGMLLARIVASGTWPKMRPRRAFLVLLGFYLVGLFVPFEFQLAGMWPLPVVLVIGALATSDLRGGRSVLHNRRLVRLGELTFAFYLLHNLVFSYGHLAFGRTETEDGLLGPSWGVGVAVAFLVGAFLVSLGLAWLLHAMVERPAFRRWSSAGRRSSSRPSQPDPEAAGRKAGLPDGSSGTPTADQERPT